MHHIACFNTADIVRDHVHGTHAKDMLVCHETVSKDAPAMSDIIGVENDLAKKDYGIHGMTDLEGHKAWARGLGDAIFWQAGGANERSVGIENVSYIPALIQAKVLTKEQAHKKWLEREKQLTALAILIACWHNADKEHHKLVRSNGNTPGVCSHWDVSQHHPESDGHWDCWPHDKGGYFPLALVIHMAKGYAEHGYSF